MQNVVIVIRPIITERSMTNAGLGWYTFAVEKTANKDQIRKEVERLFKVNVKAIRTEVVKGKTTAAGRGKRKSKKADWKKAFVRLAKEQKIDLFEVQHKEEKA